MKDLFLISGLGADQRVFEFLDLADYKLHYVEWIPPYPTESIEHYAQRLLIQIPANKPILIGVSFGGLIAIEIGKLIETDKIIIISSVQTRSDFPWYLNFAARLKLHWFIPSSPPQWILFYLFGVKKKYEKELLAGIIRDTDSTFLVWALKKIFSWKNDVSLRNVTTIHGTSDRLFTNQKADHLIQQGGHFMIVNKASEVSEYIRAILKA
jgi:pimeloyl-ACP methyl ester carboxylesterase